MLAAFPRCIAMLIRFARKPLALRSPVTSTRRFAISAKSLCALGPHGPRVSTPNGTKWYSLPRLLYLLRFNSIFKPEQKGAMENAFVENPNDPNRNTQLLTMDDLENGAPVRYDAMVLYAEANQGFVDDLAANMKMMGFRLFTGYRNDLAPGEIPHGMVCELIASRCHNIIVIYSPEFFNSDNGPEDERRDKADREVNENQYYAAYALATKIASKGEHRMIPCMYKDCALPDAYRYNFMLYCHSEAYNFHERLAKVLGTSPKPRAHPQSSMAITDGRGPSRAKSSAASSVARRIRRWCRNVSKRLRCPQNIRAN